MTAHTLAVRAAIAVVAVITGCGGGGKASDARDSPPPPGVASPPAAAPVASPTPPPVDAGVAVTAGEPRPDAGNPRPDDLVDITDLDDTIALDIRYATPDNFTKVAVYPVARCLLRRDVARRLVEVQTALRAKGYGLKMWDCYRPISIQKKFWELVPDSRYVAQPVFRDGKPVSGSKHNRGAAVDLTLVDAAGAELEMPTGYDDFSVRAHRSSRASKPARRNSLMLEKAMVAEGFAPLPTEWWHFDGPNWRRYPLSDEPL